MLEEIPVAKGNTARAFKLDLDIRIEAELRMAPHSSNV